MSDVCARLEERQRARLAALEQKKAQGREGKREEETFEYFSRELDARKTGKVQAKLAMTFSLIPFSYHLSAN